MSYYTKFGTLLVDSSTKGQQGDSSRYATLDQLRNEINNLLNIASVDQNEVVVFQDKQGRLKTSNIQMSDVLVRIPSAVVNNIVTYTDQGKIQDSGTSVNDYIKKTGDVFTGDIIMSGKKITYLGNPISDNDAATKKYVDDQESKYVSVRGGIMHAFLNMNNNGINNLRTPESDFDAATKKYVDDKEIPINNEMTSLKAEFTNHVSTFLNFRRNINKLKNDFCGEPSNIDITLADINTKLNDALSKIPDIIEKTNLIKVPHQQIKNIVYTVASGQAKWTLQTNSIKHTAEVTGVYRLSVFSPAKFSIFTKYLWRHSSDAFSETVSIVLDKDTEEEFILEPSDKKLTATLYWWCLEFVAETPQLII